MVTIVNVMSSLTIVKDGLLLTIINETTNFTKTVVFGKTIDFLKNTCRVTLNIMNIIDEL